MEEKAPKEGKKEAAFMVGITGKKDERGGGDIRSQVHPGEALHNNLSISKPIKSQAVRREG